MSRRMPAPYAMELRHAPLELMRRPQELRATRRALGQAQVSCAARSRLDRRVRRLE